MINAHPQPIFSHDVIFGIEPGVVIGIDTSIRCGKFGKKLCIWTKNHYFYLN
jgi:hypothetical protein